MELVQQGEGLLDDPAHGLVVVPGATSADHWLNASMAQQVSVLVVVIAPVGDQNVGLASRSARSPAHGRDGLDQREKFGDVVAVTAGQAGRERDSAAPANQVVFRAGLAAVDRAGAGRGSPLFARMWEASTHACNQSICPAALSSASNLVELIEDPSSRQSRRRRQQVIPEPNPNSCGRSSQPIPVSNTNRMPCSTWRSGSSFGPVRLAGRTGSTGSTWATPRRRRSTAQPSTKNISSRDHQHVRGS